MSNDPTSIVQSPEAAIITALLDRQDEVMAALDLLEAQVLEVIEELSAERKLQNADEEAEADVIKIESSPTDTAKKKPLKKAA